MKNKLLIALLFTFTASAKVTLEDVHRDGRAQAARVQGVPDAVAYQDWLDNGNPPNENGSRIDWDEMPAGTRCGTYVMSGGRVQSLTKCQGHNPRYSCPTGFSRQDFGYFEAGGGERHYNWCVKL